MDIYYEKQSKNSLLIARLSHRRWCVPAKGEAPQVSLRCRRTMHIFRQMSRHVIKSKSCCNHRGTLLSRVFLLTSLVCRYAFYRCVSVAWEIAVGSLWNVSVCFL